MFSAVGTGYRFSRAWHRLCFPGLVTSSTSEWLIAVFTFVVNGQMTWFTCIENSNSVGQKKKVLNLQFRIHYDAYLSALHRTPLPA